MTFEFGDRVKCIKSTPEDDFGSWMLVGEEGIIVQTAIEDIVVVRHGNKYSEEFLSCLVKINEIK